MPTANTIPIIDANGDGIVDGTSISIHDAAMTLYGVGYGLVSFVPGGGEAMAVLTDLLTLLGLFDDDHGGYTPAQIYDRVSLVLSRLGTVTSPYTSVAHQLNTVDENAQYIRDNLPTGSGGLTTEEHDILVDLSGDTFIGDKVWNTGLEGIDESGQQSDRPAYQWLVASGQEGMWNPAHQGYPIAGSAYWRVWAAWTHIPLIQAKFISDPVSYPLPGDPDFSDVEEGDTVWSFVNRVYPSITWTRVPPPGATSASRVAFHCPGTDFAAYIGPTFTDADIAAFWPSRGGGDVTINNAMAPVLDPTKYTMTLLTTIEFDAPFVSDVACDGITYTIGASAPRLKAWTVGDFQVLSGAGAIGFFGDDGLPEPYQWLGFDRGIVLPQSFAHASGFVFSSNIVLSGTVTPFTLTPVT